MLCAAVSADAAVTAMFSCCHARIRSWMLVKSLSSGVTQSVDQPGLAMGEVAAGFDIESAQEGPADAPAEAVIDAFLSLLNVFVAGQSHGSPL